MKPLFQQKHHGSWPTIFQVHEYPFPDRRHEQPDSALPMRGDIRAVCRKKGDGVSLGERLFLVVSLRLFQYLYIAIYMIQFWVL